jgi:dienelactone hydrolase
MTSTVAPMTEIVLFHHIQGLTSGVHAFADRLRAGGHTVHTPDSFEGRTFASIDEGEAYCSEIGFQAIRDRGIAQAQDLPAEVVYGGFSLGVMAAQTLTQTRPGARALLAYHGFADPSYFGTWPEGTPVQIHAMDADPYFVGEGDLEPAQKFVDAHAEAELFLYPGDGHLFADDTLDAYDADATDLLVERTLELLGRRDG